MKKLLTLGVAAAAVGVAALRGGDDGGAAPSSSTPTPDESPTPDPGSDPGGSTESPGTTVKLTSDHGADPSYTIRFSGGIMDSDALESQTFGDGYPEGHVDSNTGQGVAREDVDEWTGMGSVSVTNHPRSKTDLKVKVNGRTEHVSPGETREVA